MQTPRLNLCSAKIVICKIRHDGAHSAAVPALISCGTVLLRKPSNPVQIANCQQLIMTNLDQGSRSSMRQMLGK